MGLSRGYSLFSAQNCYQVISHDTPQEALKPNSGSLTTMVVITQVDSLDLLGAMVANPMSHNKAFVKLSVAQHGVLHGWVLEAVLPSVYFSFKLYLLLIQLA